eukprot:3931710-Rhodomonas_salina.6
MGILVLATWRKSARCSPASTSAPMEYALYIIPRVCYAKSGTDLAAVGHSATGDSVAGFRPPRHRAAPAGRKLEAAICLRAQYETPGTDSTSRTTLRLTSASLETERVRLARSGAV